MKYILTISLYLFCNFSIGQSNPKLALEKGRAGVKAMEEGKIDESIALLSEAMKLDPRNGMYPYELAYLCYTAKEYETAITVIERTLDYENVGDQHYQLLGNSYDLNNNPEKAIEVYDSGIKKFPESGRLYLEKANVYAARYSIDQALPIYEKGIEVDPTFSSNYYQAARIYCNGTENIWGIMYAEIFLNLEPNSKRSAEISKLLFDTYKNHITVEDSKASVDFCRNITVYADEPNKLPFCVTYASTFLIGIDPEIKNIDLKSLDLIRQQFIANYYYMKRDKIHPNVLFDYQKSLADADHFEAYNYWLLKNGDEPGFKNWQSRNQKKWERFLKWDEKNKFSLNKKNKFFRTQY